MLAAKEPLSLLPVLLVICTHACCGSGAGSGSACLSLLMRDYSTGEISLQVENLTQREDSDKTPHSSAFLKSSELGFTWFQLICFRLIL